MKTIKYFPIAFLLIFFACTTLASHQKVFADENTDSARKKPPSENKSLLIPVPGPGRMDEKFKIPVYEEGEGMYTIRIVEEYLAYLYPYAAALISLMAVLMTVIGSIQIITAGGDSAQVTTGKNRIFYAIAGVVILLLSSLILYTINPAFFAFG